MTDFVIINYNTPELTCNCIKSIYGTYKSNSKIIVVDNCSMDNSVDIIMKNYPNVLIIQNKQNLGYSKAVNIGVAATNSEFVIVSNSDVEYHHNSVRILEQMMIEEQNIGVSGFFQIYPDGLPQRSYGYCPGFKLAMFELFLINSILERINMLNRRFNIFIPNSIDVDYIDGASLLVRKSVFNKLDGFDEDYFFYSEEADYCYRVSKAGYRNVINPKAIITHIRGASSVTNFDQKLKSELMNQESNILFLKKNCSNFQMKFFRFARIFHFNLLYIISKIFAKMTKGNKKNHYTSMGIIYREISQLWRKTKFEK